MAEHNSRGADYQRWFNIVLDVPSEVLAPPDKPGKVLPFITGPVLQKMVVNLSASRANELAALMNRILPKYELDNLDTFHEFFATVAHESGGFRRKDENLNYSAARLLEVFPKYFSSATAKTYAHKPEAIANKVYANRMGNRGADSGDGWRNRGGGFIQLTGMLIWELYARYIGKTVKETQELVRTTDEYALDSACWYFSIYASLNDEAQRDEFKTITMRVNGGLNGYQDRLDYLYNVKRYMPITA